MSAAPRAPHLRLGAAGEEAALTALLRGGRRLLARNWRPAGPARGLELDIVLREEDTIVFVEVKTRGADDGRPALGAFTRAKQARFVRAARHWLAAHGLWASPCRFDLVCARLGVGGAFDLEHYRNVVELGQTLGGRNAPWQPW